MMMQLKPVEEQVVVLMGTSSGIGRESAARFARRGATAVVSARGAEGGAPPVAGARSVGGGGGGPGGDLKRQRAGVGRTVCPAGREGGGLRPRRGGARLSCGGDTGLRVGGVYLACVDHTNSHEHATR